MRSQVLSDGTAIAESDWVCVPQREIMNDPLIYPAADQFDARRFMKSHGQVPAGLGPKFTNVDPFYPFWGLGRQAW